MIIQKPRRKAMKKLFVAIFILLGASPCFALNSVLDFTDFLVYNPREGIRIQTSAANPLLTQLISDNLSHILTLSSVQASSLNPIIYFSLHFNGTGTGCQVRLMHTATKASWVAYPIAAASTFGQGIHPNTAYINYSGCYN